MNDRCYSALANAVIVQACKDYRTARRCLAKTPQTCEDWEQRYAAWELYFDLVRFFYSPRYARLTKVDRDYLLERLDKELKQ